MQLLSWPLEGVMSACVNRTNTGLVSIRDSQRSFGCHQISGSVFFKSNPDESFLEITNGMSGFMAAVDQGTI